jgi:hypothetical protein
MAIKINKNGVIKATGKDANDIFNAFRKAYGLDKSTPADSKKSTQEKEASND